MRVVLLNQYYAPADAPTARLLADLGEGLARAGHEVLAICSRRAYTDPRRTHSRRETLLGVEVRRVWSTGFGRARRLGRIVDYATFLIGAAWTLARVRRPEVVVSLSSPPFVAWLGVTLARFKGARSIYWVMDVYPELAFALGVLRADSWLGRLFRRLSEGTLRRCDRIVALGPAMARQLGRAPKVAVIHNWADGRAIRPQPIAGHPLRAAAGWSERFVVLYSGNLGLAHEFDTVLRAARLLQRRPEMLFAFVGGGPRLQQVRRNAVTLGLPNVIFKPYVPQEALGQSLTSADLHLITLLDGLCGLLVPSKIYGILAAGRPTVYVGEAGGEVATILEQGRCGERVAVGDAAGLAAAIERYADDAPRREAAGRRARELFEARFDRPRGVAEFRALIESDP